jgi:enhancing lycopene biosynthesis protein 2
MTRVGVVLSGCGFKDGAEIHESVLTLLYLDMAGAEVSCFAPDRAQTQVVQHITDEVLSESRNVLTESGRIARGEIQDVREANIDELDAIILPGGLGAASNLSSFATDGAGATIDEGVSGLLKAAHAAGKPIGAICIAPALVALALGKESPSLTIGNDEGTAAALAELGVRHIDCSVNACVVDPDNKIVTTPAYMLGPGIADIASGIERLVAAVLKLA